jgi:hypothetical protein
MARLRDLEKDAYKMVNNWARSAAKEIMNGLAESGPEWSGDFKDSWVADAPGGGAGAGGYPYALSEIPQLPATKREAERQTKFVIYNSAPHAAIAMDLVDVPAQDFEQQGSPKGEVVARGTRPDNGKRGEVSPGAGKRGNATSTAPLFWYQTFVQGGKMQKALERGVRVAPPPRQ